MFLHGVITELTHFSEAGLPHALQILMHLLTRFLVRVSSSLQKLRNSLASVCSWCAYVIFHRCVEGASTLIVVLEEQDHPMQFITPMAQNSFPELYAGSTILEEYLPACIPDQWCLSLIPLLFFIVTWAEQHLWVVVCEEGYSCTGHLHRWSVAACVGPRGAQVPLPCLRL